LGNQGECEEEGSMTPIAKRLPSRFPEGTKFVIENRARKGRAPVYVRHLEFPDGTMLRLPERPGIVTGKAMPRRRRARRD
jgi:hypothetical protein